MYQLLNHPQIAIRVLGKHPMETPRLKTLVGVLLHLPLEPIPANTSVMVVSLPFTQLAVEMGQREAFW